jgi:repressor LexA
MNLTTRQQQVLSLIRSHIQKSGMPPTRADIAAEFGFKSANAAEEHLKALARKGAIEIIPGTSRGIRLCDAEPAGIPLVGRVAAGNPILAQEHIEDRVQLDPTFFKPQADYLLQVVGDSMIDIGIFEGDYLAVHNTPVANNGDIIVARVDDEVTVKRLTTTRSKYIVHLQPENSDYSAIEVDLRNQQFQIEGISVGVLRR